MFNIVRSPVTGFDVVVIGSGLYKDRDPTKTQIINPYEIQNGSRKLECAELFINFPNYEQANKAKRYLMNGTKQPTWYPSQTDKTGVASRIEDLSKSGKVL